MNTNDKLIRGMKKIMFTGIFNFRYTKIGKLNQNGTVLMNKLK